MKPTQDKKLKEQIESLLGDNDFDLFSAIGPLPMRWLLADSDATIADKILALIEACGYKS